MWIDRGLMVVAALLIAGLIAIELRKSPAEPVGPITAALVSLVVRFIDALTPRLVLGLGAAWLAARMFRATLDAAEQGGGMRYPTHWGGLAAGEGGWELEPSVLRGGLRVLALTALSFSAGWLLLATPKELGASESSQGTASTSAPTAASGAQGTANGGAGSGGSGGVPAGGSAGHNAEPASRSGAAMDPEAAGAAGRLDGVE